MGKERIGRIEKRERGVKCHNEIPYYDDQQMLIKTFFKKVSQDMAFQILSLEQLVAGERATMTLTWRNRETRAEYDAKKT